ncbi:NADP-dependent oxidoreductase [Actinoallomurus soli]|uniref:NADP-dependent oxidoreductase n=1 Tax=Actinoallomurus soli TaxID=2952535 RepID=UPI002092D278|nr:NADP-dependent oxidoreductase [Actinoallomurus soli]MCO5970329.1 NADP-dependent oxidoreductase [Actinoallomurus soli]
MRSVIITRPGDPSVLEIAERPKPQPGPHQVVIRTAAATVNPTDVLLREQGGGELPPPWTPGTEVAGTVEAVGEGADFQPGERVFAAVYPRRPEGGAQAELVLAPAASVVRTPDGVPDVEAATIPMNGLTVLQALRRLNLPPGATLGVIGSAGAVGQYAVQLGVHAGLRVLADAKPGEEELVRGFGAHEVIPRSDNPGAAFRAVVPDGVDGLIDAAVLDAAALAPIRDGGALATLRFWTGPTERGIRIEPILVLDDMERTESLQELADHLRTGRLTTRIADTYPVDRVQEAHRRLAAGGVRGRLVLVF